MPTSRPGKRIRANAYAIVAPSTSATAADDTETSRLLRSRPQ